MLETRPNQTMFANNLRLLLRKAYKTRLSAFQVRASLFISITLFCVRKRLGNNVSVGLKNFKWLYQRLMNLEKIAFKRPENILVGQKLNLAQFCFLKRKDSVWKVLIVNTTNDTHQSGWSYSFFVNTLDMLYLWFGLYFRRNLILG